MLRVKYTRVQLHNGASPQQKCTGTTGKQVQVAYYCFFLSELLSFLNLQLLFILSKILKIPIEKMGQISI